MSSTKSKKIRFLEDLNGFKAGQVYIVLEDKANIYISNNQATEVLEAIDDSKIYVVGSDVIKELESYELEKLKNEYIYNAQDGLARWRAALSKARAGYGKARISFIGDSISEGFYSGIVGDEENRDYFIENGFIGQLRKSFSGESSLQDVGIGLIPANYPRDDTKWVYSGDTRFTTNFGYGIAGRAVVLENQPTTATLTFNGTGIKIYYVEANSAGGIGFTVDSDPEIIVNANSGTIQNASYEITGLTDGAHTLVVRNGTASTYLIGAEEIKGINGVVCNTCALAGSYVLDHIKTFDSGGSTLELVIESEIDNLTPDLCVISLMANDSYGQRDLVDYEQGLQTLIDRAKSVNSDVLLTSLGVRNLDGGAGNAILQSSYVSIIRKLAIENNVAYYDNFNKWKGDFNYPKNLGLLYDDVHWNFKGHNIIANDIYNIVK